MTQEEIDKLRSDLKAALEENKKLKIRISNFIEFDVGEVVLVVSKINSVHGNEIDISKRIVDKADVHKVNTLWCAKSYGSEETTQVFTLEPIKQKALHDGYFFFDKNTLMKGTLFPDKQFIDIFKVEPPDFNECIEIKGTFYD